jgi:DnaJ family protein B protein 11
MSHRHQQSSFTSLLVIVSVVLLVILGVIYAAKDYYAILSVPRNADGAQIKRAYKKLAIQYHPDRNQGDKTSEQKFLEISKAYEVLSDEKTRQIYDKYGEEGLNNQQRQQQQQGGAGGFDIFEQFFGGGAPGGGFHFNFGGGGDMFGESDDSESEDEFKGDDLRVPLEVTLEDLYSSKMMEFHRVRSAHHDNAQPKPCQCRNRMIRMTVVNGVMKRVVDNNCEECQNRFDVVQKTSDLTIQIDQGMQDGETITFFGEGDATASHRSGDLIFVIRALPHKVFQRNGNDLRMRLDITLKEALVGFTRKIQRLDGTDFELTISEIIRQGEVRRFRGEGMPARTDPSTKGELHIEFHITFPTSLTDAQKKQLSEIL